MKCQQNTAAAAAAAARSSSSSSWDYFPRFMYLPCELRTMIWHLARPQRVIKMSSLMEAHSLFLDDPVRVATAPAAGDLARPETLSRVCRDSRDVVLRRRLRAADVGMPWLGVDAWIDRRTDVLEVDCYVTRAAAGFIGMLGIPVVVTWDEMWSALTHPLLRNPPAVDRAYLDMWEAVARGISATGNQNWPVVMDTLTVAVPPEAVAARGLLGLFGEQDHAYVDYSDVPSLALLHELRDHRLDRRGDVAGVMDSTLRQWSNCGILIYVLWRGLDIPDLTVEQTRLSGVVMELMVRCKPSPCLKVNWIRRGPSRTQTENKKIMDSGQTEDKKVLDSDPAEDKKT